MSVSDGKIISGLRTCLREIKPLSEEVKMHRKVKKKRKTSDNVEKERRDGHHWAHRKRCELQQRTERNGKVL